MNNISCSDQTLGPTDQSDQSDQLIPSDKIINKLSFDDIIPKEFKKDKKMSLLITVLLDIIFSNKEKRNIIYKYLASKKILNLDVLSENYDDIRDNLSFLVQSLNDMSVTNNNIFNNLLKESNQSNQSNELNQSNQSNELIELNRSIELNQSILLNQSNDELNLELSDQIINYINKYRNNYNELYQLGSGGFGSVYKVFHKFEKKFYAIKKVFLTEDLIKEQYNIFSEIELFSSFEHKHIIKYNTSWVDFDISSIIEYNMTFDEYKNNSINSLCPILFIQMELCEFTLKDYIQSYMLSDSIDERIEYFKQILYGIKYLHDNNIIHRDIKPANIFFSSNIITSKLKQYDINDSDKITNSNNKYIVKIGDFGLSKELKPHIYKSAELAESTELAKSAESTELANLAESTELAKSAESTELADLAVKKIISLTSNVGTSIYCAPETKTNNYNHLIDIYSLGIVFVELLMDYKNQYERLQIFNSIKEDILYLDIAFKYKQIITDKYNNIIKQMICLVNNRLSIDQIIELLNNLN